MEKNERCPSQPWHPKLRSLNCWDRIFIYILESTIAAEYPLVMENDTNIRIKLQNSRGEPAVTWWRQENAGVDLSKQGDDEHVDSESNRIPDISWKIQIYYIE